MKVKENYESGTWRRFVRFINGEEMSEDAFRLPEEMVRKQDKEAEDSKYPEAVHSDLYRTKRERNRSDFSRMMEQYENR